MSNQLKPGDKVHWTHVNQGKRVLSMRRREGVIVEVDDKGAFVRYSQRTVWIELERLRTEGQPSQVSEFVEAMVESSRERTG
jgi:hypothetical protein